MGTYAVFFLLVMSISIVNGINNVTKKYPQDALKCYATLSPNDKIICPASRNKFCVKEVVVNASRKNCGRTPEFPHDIWDTKDPRGTCIYRKCAASCLNKSVPFGSSERQFHCCSTNLCNNAPASHRQVFAIVMISYISVVLFLVWIRKKGFWNIARKKRIIRIKSNKSNTFHV